MPESLGLPLAPQNRLDALLHELPDALPVVVCFVDNEQRYVYTNRGTEEWLSRPRQEIVGQRIVDLLGPEAYAAIREYVEVALRGEEVTFEQCLPLPGGERWVRASYIPHRSASGQVDGFYAFAVDTTEQHRAIRLARLSQERYRAVVDTQRELISRFRPDTTLTFVNDAYCRFFGRTREELLGQSFLEVVPEEAHAEIRRRFAQLGRDPRRVTADYRVTDSDGKLHWQRWTDTPIFVGGRLVEWQASGIDLTEQRRLEEELLRVSNVQTLGVLASGVAHDFTNLLSGLIAMADVTLAQLPEGSAGRWGVEEMRAASESGLALTRRLLRFTRPQLDPSQTSAELDPMVQASRALLDVLIGHQCVLAVINEAPGLRVSLDPGELEHALVNLGVNARDAMPDGGNIEIHVRLREVDAADGPSDLHPGRYAVIEVVDSGTGMDEETRRRALEPFFTTKPEPQGTGLGLSSVHGLVARAGGKVEIESQPGQGTTVRLLLPVVEPDSPQERRESE